MTPEQLGAPLPAAFYARPAREVAPDLLGKLLRSTLGDVDTVGRIVETEAYTGPEDPACHAAERIGRTARNAAMFGPPGTAYVFLSYGIHWCLNAVTDRVDYPAAVLIRALEPIAGLDTMRERRGTRDRDLARGPGRLTQALGITGGLDGHALDYPPLTIHDAPEVASDVPAGQRAQPGPGAGGLEVEAGPRIGITHAADWPLRFTVKGSRWLSG